MKGFLIRNTHMKYESSIFNGLKIMAKVKVFVHTANNADEGNDVSFTDICPGSLKKLFQHSGHSQGHNATTFLSLKRASLEKHACQIWSLKVKQKVKVDNRQKSGQQDKDNMKCIIQSKA